MIRPTPSDAWEDTLPISLRYRVPVVVEIEPETDEVLSVHILDEAIEGPLDAHDHAGSPVRAEDRDRALQVAESARWPGWTAGT